MGLVILDPVLKAVLFDVDFTLFRPGPELGPEGYRRLGERHGLVIGLISNGQRDLEEFAEHHALDVDAVVGSKAHGRVKPHASIFVAALRALDARPEETAMVGDSYEDDIEGARALGIRAILLDRDGVLPDTPDRIDTLFALPAALGLVRS